VGFSISLDRTLQYKWDSHRLKSLLGNSILNTPAAKAALICVPYGTAEAVPHKHLEGAARTLKPVPPKPRGWIKIALVRFGLRNALHSKPS
jgi:hypothetical protein